MLDSVLGYSDSSWPPARVGSWPRASLRFGGAACMLDDGVAIAGDWVFSRSGVSMVEGLSGVLVLRWVFFPRL